MHASFALCSECSCGCFPQYLHPSGTWQVDHLSGVVAGRTGDEGILAATGSRGHKTVDAVLLAGEGRKRHTPPHYVITQLFPKSTTI